MLSCRADDRGVVDANELSARDGLRHVQRMAFSVHMDVNLGFKSKSRTCRRELSKPTGRREQKITKKSLFFCAVNGLSLFICCCFFISPFTLCFEKRLRILRVYAVSEYSNETKRK